jgi:hypothetical protein
MRHYRKRGRKPVKKYSLSYLLSRQPKSLRKNEYYPIMLNYFYSSSKLQTLRFSRRCYSLLLHAKIDPHNLHHFYRTYRLPRDPFFPLYFKIKREYMQEQQRKKEEKTRYIADTMRRLPPPILEFIKYLARLEQRYNYSNRYPMWNKHLFPTTKKRVHEYLHFDFQDWIGFFRHYLDLLAGRYRALTGKTKEKLLACFILECLPELRASGREPKWPDEAQVIRQYRRLSLQHHPDQGGNGQVFVELQRARDLLSSG